MLNILVVYYNLAHPLRAALADHLLCLRRYAPGRCFYLNMAVRRAPAYLQTIPFHIVVFHTLFLSMRWDREFFVGLMRDAEPLRCLNGVRVALPQDEFLNTDLLCEFINTFAVQHVFSTAPEREWQKIYATVDREKVRISKVLTGYLDERRVRQIDRVVRRGNGRPIDVGYRAWRAEAWLGRHGLLKAEIADHFQRSGSTRRLATDISTDEADTLLGNQWYEFLARCRYTIGVEGGASILDRDGTVRDRTREYVASHPRAGLDEIERACFPGLEGSLDLRVISPRHLEACATRTGQVLIEGAYSGVLSAGRHYIELKRDFSNLDHVVELMADEPLRQRLTLQAYRDVVESGKYTYRTWARWLVAQVLGADAAVNAPWSERLRRWMIWVWAACVDRASWVVVAWLKIARAYRFRVRLRRVLVGMCSERAVRFATVRARRLVGR